ncbi:MAG: hypothetical protein SFU25_10945 [Candidatus Caenarcaniphilales bacterium]|nr:hypothetical protein [Candidatus Caenarcaniphilales bacterium]
MATLSLGQVSSADSFGHSVSASVVNSERRTGEPMETSVPSTDTYSREETSFERFIDGFLDGKAGLIQIARAETNEERLQLISLPFALGRLALPGAISLLAGNAAPTAEFAVNSLSQGIVGFVLSPNEENVQVEDNILGLRRALSSNDPYDWGRFAFNLSDIALVPFMEGRITQANRRLSSLPQAINSTKAVDNALTREQIVQELLEQPIVPTSLEGIKNLFSNGNLGHQAYTLYKDGEVITVIEQVNKINGDIVSRTQLNSPSIAFVLHDFDHAITTSMVDARGEDVNAILANTRDLWRSNFNEPILSRPASSTEAIYKNLRTPKTSYGAVSLRAPRIPSNQELLGMSSSNWPQILKNRMTDSGQIRLTYNQELVNLGLMNETQVISDGGRINQLDLEGVQPIYGFGYLDNFDRMTWEEFAKFWSEVNPQYWESLASSSSANIQY